MQFVYDCFGIFSTWQPSNERATVAYEFQTNNLAMHGRLSLMTLLFYVVFMKVWMCFESRL